MRHSMKYFSFSLVLLCLILSDVVQAQERYNPEFLIPYNDHGKWGFSDTLGTVKVTPEFESVNFFYNVDNAWLSRVYRGDELVYYVLNKGCASPVGYKTDYMLFSSFFLENSISVIEKDGKVGLFNYETQKIVLEATYTKATPDVENGIVYFSRFDEKDESTSILAYDVYSNRESRLKYVEIKTEGVESGDGVQEYILFRDKRNRWFEFSNGKWLQFPYWEMNFIKNYDEYYLRESVATAPELTKKLFNEVASYRTDKVVGATLHSSIEISYSQSYQVMWKDGSFGLYQGEKQLLPFNYDFIDIDYEHGFFYLLRDKKMGAYLPGTTYPRIEPKYGLINFYKKLQVNDKWLFVLFKVKKNGFDGYVGENGVEFFNFD